MKETFKDYKESKILSKPFNEKGEPKLTTSIVATLIDGKPLTRKLILTKLGYDITGKSDGYLANFFSELSKCGIICFSKSELALKQGENFQRYLNFIFISLLKADKKIVDGLKYRMLPKKDSQSLDFITSPTEDIFSKPNPYLELVTTAGIEQDDKLAS